MSEKKLAEYYVKRLQELGAVRAKWIDPATVVTAAWVGHKCRFGCPTYGKNRCCPPNTPTYRETRELLGEYTRALLVEGRTLAETSNIVVAAARELFLDGYYKVIALGSGPCTLCETCAPEGCRFPGKAIPSMEACGVDVFATVRANGYDIDVVKGRGDEMTAFGLLLVE
ncbi:MAG TPA: hypothetical protein DIC53_06975 [Synergistaceae bacterium]|jgi:predicted metal-binding protein|nr:hypothetical protein [Synergistaceae bacterium]